MIRTAERSEAEFQILTTDAGRDLLAEVGWVSRPSPADFARWRKSHRADHVAAAIDVVTSRRRARPKFDRADLMWFDSVGLEQATAEPVARRKAARFAGALAIDLCAGIGGDSIAIAEVARGVVSVDLDCGMTRRARWNAEVYGVGHRIAPVRGRAEAFAIPPDCLVHIDPDRRAHSPQKSRSIDGYAPGLDYLRALPSKARGGAIKLGAATDFAGGFAGLAVEIEIVSLDGECKEATVWFGELATTNRRATRLPDGATWTDRDGPPGLLTLPTDRPGAWVFDADPSLIRSGLLDGFASAHGLRRLLPGCDFLTGDSPVRSPFVTPFEVDEALPLDLKRLRRTVADRRLGPLEIKTRGLDLRPEDLRRSLRPDGPNPATLLLAGGRGPSMAIVARREG